MTNNRGPAPSPQTKYQLIAKAAGRCQFCNKWLFNDPITLTDNNDSNLAHIIASSPDGPRGDSVLSHELSNKIDNLMLMCTEHHHLIDNNEKIYTAEVLRELKKERESRINDLTESCTLSQTEIVIFQSPIKGKVRVSIPVRDAVQAILLKYVPASTNGITISIDISFDYKSREYWQKAIDELEYQFNKNIESVLKRFPELRFSVFPIAPIPLIMKLGELFQDKINVDIYQKTRSPDTWKWLSDEPKNKFIVNKKCKHLKSDPQIALILGLTADITEERVNDVMSPDIVYRISAKQNGVDCISSAQDLSNFWHTYQDVLDEIRNNHPLVKEISLFPAIPISAAFEVGRRFMPGIYPKLKIYDDYNGFFETIVIGG